MSFVVTLKSREVADAIAPGTLLAKDEVFGDQAVVTGWRREAVADFAARLGNDDFPCLFGRKVWNSGTLRFAFVPVMVPQGCDAFVRALRDYTDLVKCIALEDRLRMPLVVFFDASVANHSGSLHALGWDILNLAHQQDPAPWPPEVPMSPDHPDWCFCFNGVQLFINMSTPEHQVLRNRNLGRHLTFVINPRENFDAVASITNRSGRLVRERIRSRVDVWNGGIVPSELGFYGDGESREWKQYQLQEAAVPRAVECPFHSKSAPTPVGMKVPHAMIDIPREDVRHGAPELYLLEN